MPEPAITKLVEMYNSGMTSRAIAAATGMAARTVIRRLHSAGVQMRLPGPPHRPELHDVEWLKREYLEKGKSTTQIARELQCSVRSVAYRLQKAGIQARPTGATKGHKRNASPEVREKQSAARRGRFIGPANNNWKGGIAMKDPERGRYRAKMWIKAIKDRDGWTCTKCGSTDRLHAHHIKPWRYYPDLRYDLNNGVTLCYTCHEAAHGRGWKFRWRKTSRNVHECAGPSKKRA